jgi:acyl-coenzyme A synthetase/AMP-(fatty) acid ligase
VAVPFIDRHLQEGRKDKVIIRTSGGEAVTYGQLAERVNQSGNVLKKFGLNLGDRLLMVVKDAPEFFYLFWGAIKSGIIPVPLNTLLRAKDYTFMIEYSGCTAVVYSFIVTFVRFRRRGFARKYFTALERANRYRDFGRHRFHRSPAHFYFQSRRRHQIRK